MTTLLEPAIRARVHEELIEYALRRGGPKPGVVIDELGLRAGRVLADVALITPVSLELYEIKSDADSCARLARQVEVYGELANRCTLVVGEKLVGATKVPDWWQIVRVDSWQGYVETELVRAGAENPQQDPRKVADMLWSDEAGAELRLRGVKGISRMNLRRRLDALVELVTLEELRALIYLRVAARVWRGGRSAPRAIASPEAA